MTDDHLRGGEGAAAQDGAGDTTTSDWSSWSNLWQVPVIAGSIAAIGLGLWVALNRAPQQDFNGALDQVDSLIARGQFDAAAERLNKVIEPNLEVATPAQRARYHAQVGDWVSMAQGAGELRVSENAQKIATAYEEAESLGARLDPPRVERWADALLDVGNIESARQRLRDLEVAAASASDGDARLRRNRVLRRVVEESLRRNGLSHDDLMTLLEEYHRDPMLSPADELWALSLEAETRLDAGKPQEALDRLLLDIRRFEPRLQESPELGLGELYSLLARAYRELGDLRYASFHANEAINLLPVGSPRRGQATVLLGKIAVSNGEWGEALELFDEAVRNYWATDAGLPGLLGRAEVNSVLGHDAASIADYTQLRDELAQGPPRRDLTAEMVAASLADRHDQALTEGRLPEALDYVTLAASSFPADEVPIETTMRIAATNRQLADDLIDAARRALGDPEQVPLARVDPTVRAVAAAHFKQAADHFVRHARSLAGNPDDDEAWARSLWMAADSYDLAGWPELAIEHFREYVAGRSEKDPMRIEAKFRLAQAHHAGSAYAQAADWYQQVIDEHRTSHVAARSYVPLARCLLALDRRPEAQRLLQVVLRGETNLRPEAIDFRDALIELGTSLYRSGDYVAAIEQLDEAVARYPDHPDIDQIRFRLADSYRRRVAELEKQGADPVTTPAQARQLANLRLEHLRAAMDHFGRVGGGAGSNRVDPRTEQYAGLYRADGAYALGDYGQAIDLYDQVAGRWPRDVVSLEALVQIVNCYANLGDDERKRHAHQRALARLNELPDGAFNDPDVLLDREKFQEWLKNMPVGATALAR